MPGIETIEYIIYATCGVVWILSILRCLSLRQLAREAERARMTPSPEGELPPFSVIITSQNQCEELRHNLPIILNQIYPNFEVLVVDINSKDETKKLLEKMEEDHSNLRHTFTTSSGRDISTQRLAITLGIKAATNPWTIITQADCSPISHLWLRRLGESIKGHRSAEIAIGFTRTKQARSYIEHKMSFYRLWQQMKTFGLVQKHGAYRCDATNLAYKKELFLSHQGFATHANLLMGATDIMVNQNSTKHNTVVCLHPEATIEQQMPPHKNWVLDRLYFRESRKYFKHKAFFEIKSIITGILPPLRLVTMLATIAIAVWQEQYFIAAIALLLWMVHFGLQGKMFNATMKELCNTTQSHLRTASFMHMLPYWHIRILLQHTFSNKQKYRKKYI